MLVLSRRANERIVFPGFQAAVQVVSIKSGVVRLGIDAPPDVKVLREELHCREAGRGPDPAAPAGAPAAPPAADLRRLVEKRLQVLGRGMDLLRRQLPAPLPEDAAVTLAELEDELRLLAERLGDGVKAALPGPGRRYRALLVEDNASERELMARCLRWQSLDVDTAGDGADALDYLRARGRPDVLLLDMALPRCDGPTTVREIRRSPAYAGLKIFAVTGYPASEFDLPVGPGGVDRWFQKPVDPAELVSQLARELEAPAGGA